MFNSVDTNKDGDLSVDEVSAFLTSGLPADTNAVTIETTNTYIFDTFAITDPSLLTPGEFITFIDSLPKDANGLPDLLSLLDKEKAAEE